MDLNMEVFSTKTEPSENDPAIDRMKEDFDVRVEGIVSEAVRIFEIALPGDPT